MYLVAKLRKRPIEGNYWTCYRPDVEEEVQGNSKRRSLSVFLLSLLNVVILVLPETFRICRTKS